MKQIRCKYEFVINVLAISVFYCTWVSSYIATARYHAEVINQWASLNDVSS